MITPFNDWPTWLKILVLGPNFPLLIVLRFWWPKNNKAWGRFGLLLIYLVVFFLVMHYVFKF